jgi:hypothetical protein
VAASIVRLPLFAAMSDAELEDVADATCKVVDRLVGRGVPVADASG